MSRGPSSNLWTSVKDPSHPLSKNALSFFLRRSLSEMDDGEYCILWNNYHEALVSTLCALQREGEMADVTVVCGDGSRVRAHQLILAACSSFFRDFLRENPSKDPIILLPMEIRYPELRAMVEFMYTGQVCVSQDRLQNFMRGARYLRIRGVEDTTEDSFMDVECQHCHSKKMLLQHEAPSSAYLCVNCISSSSKQKDGDQRKKKKMKRRIQIATTPEGTLVKKIKLEPEEESIELRIGEELAEDEAPRSITPREKKEPSISTSGWKKHFDITTVTVKKQKRTAGASSSDSKKDCYSNIAIKKEPQDDSNATVFRVLGIFGVTGRKKRYSVTEAELQRRQGPPEHFSNNAMKTYLRFPRTHDALPVKFRTPSQRKTTLSTFTNIVEGEAADLAKDFQRFLFASNLIEQLCKGVNNIGSISEVLDQMLDNLAHVDWLIKFNLLTHGSGLMFVKAVLLYVRSAAH
ncbi:longitudinals lacking protein, isoforms H/M/V-like isoform X5 [Macrobrachium nipponense]|uniref:longitudinals lacking protein, isoforms H/M/V-like isoform X5 n=1 Tax=Macrobrachium nipponense TaxID=159736 RepID=UPI0030C8D3E0